MILKLTLPLTQRFTSPSIVGARCSRRSSAGSSDSGSQLSRTPSDSSTSQHDYILDRLKSHQRKSCREPLYISATVLESPVGAIWGCVAARGGQVRSYAPKKIGN